MRSARLAIFWAGISTLTLLGCGGKSEVNENALMERRIERVIAASPTRALLVDLESKAIDALKNSDAGFWESYLHDNFVRFSAGKRLDKAAEIKRINDTKCSIEKYSFSDESMVPIGNDAVVLTAKTTVEGTCRGQKIPSPTISATLFVRNRDAWQSAYSSQVLIDVSGKKETTRSASTTKPLVETDVDRLTSDLFAIEKRAWSARTSKNRSQFEALVTEDVSRVEASGTVHVGKRAVADSWTDPACSFERAEPSDPAGYGITPMITMLAYRGVLSGKCQKGSISDVWGTTIFQKDGGEWKMVYIFEVPA